MLVKLKTHLCINVVEHLHTLQIKDLGQFFSMSFKECNKAIFFSNLKNFDGKAEFSAAIFNPRCHMILHKKF